MQNNSDFFDYEKFQLESYLEDSLNLDVISNDLKKSAKDLQQQLCELFGYNKVIIWDNYGSDDKNALERKIRLIFNSDGTAKVEKSIQNIIEAIWKQRKYNNGSLLMAPVFILCVNYPTYKNNITNAVYSINYTIHPIFRIRKCVNDDDSHNCCMVFVDEHARVYPNWTSYLKTNSLQKVILVAPKSGIYNCGSFGHVLLETVPSPDCGVGKQIVKYGDISTTVAAMGSTAVLLGAMLTPIAVPALSGATVITAVCGGYTAIRSVFSLVDRSKHEQSISIADKNARGDWLGAVGGVIGIAAGGSTKLLSRFAANGQNIGESLQIAVNVVNGMAITSNGCGVVNGFLTVYLRLRDKESVSELDILQLGTSLFLFTHSIYNFQSAKNIIKSSEISIISQFKSKLSKNQQQIFDKIVNETIRIRGGVTGRKDIIRYLKNIPEQNDGQLVIPTATDSIIKYSSNINPADSHGTYSIGNKFNYDLLLSPNNGSLDKFILSLSKHAIQMILSKSDFKTVLSNILRETTVKCFDKFMSMAEEFFVDFGNNIEKELKRFIPFECFVSDAFKVVKTIAGEQSIETVIDYYRSQIFEAIKCFYVYQKPLTGLEKTCKTCNGKYSEQKI